MEPITLRSQSGQFVVRGLPLGQSLTALSIPGGVSYVQLDPALLTVTLERIKAAVLTKLNLRDEWQGPVYLTVQPSPRYNEPIIVMRMRHPDNWSYHVRLPEQVDKGRFLKAAVEIVLGEIVNRASQHPAELPPWLVAGLAAELQATVLMPLTLESRTTTVRAGRVRPPLQRVRELLREKIPLRLDDLNFPPSLEEMSAEELELFENCAHLFVHGLLDLRDGPQSLANMLRGLANHLNWQTTFMRAFHGHFPRLVDVDKWWALQVVLVSGRDMFSVWPEKDSLHRLAEILDTAVQVRTRADELPLTTQVKLQKIITEWDQTQQTALCRRKLHLLESIRSRVPQNIGLLVDGYRQVVGDYLASRGLVERTGDTASERPTPHLDNVARETINRLDALDAQRDSLRDRIVAASPEERENVEGLKR